MVFSNLMLDFLVFLSALFTLKCHMFQLLAPPRMRAPVFGRRNSDSSVTMRLSPASEKHGPISHYFVVVVVNDLADIRQPENFSLTEVGKLSLLSML